jgi:hypothetical protein
VLLFVVVFFGYRKHKRKEERSEQQRMQRKDDEAVLEREQHFFTQSERLLRMGDEDKFFAVLNREFQWALTALLGLTPGTSVEKIVESAYRKNPSAADGCKQLMENLNRIVYAYTAPETPPAMYYEQAQKLTEAFKG